MCLSPGVKLPELDPGNLNVVPRPGMCGTVSRSHISLRGVLFNETRGRFHLTGIEHFIRQTVAFLSSKTLKTFRYTVTWPHDAAVP